MADTLFDKVKNSGKITEDATKRAPASPLTDLSAAMGQNIPTDQLSAQLLGANPDQTKMVGGQPQLRNAIQKNAENPTPDGPTDLATQQREQQTRKTPTAQEQEQIDQQKQLASLGTLGSRVQNLVNQKLDLQDKTLTLDLDASNPLVTGLTDDQKSQAKDLILKISSGAASPQDTVALNTLLGRDINTVFKPEELQALLKSPEQIAEEQAAREVQDNVTLADLTPAELGYNSYDELATDLNIDPSKMADMSVNDLIAAVQSKQRTDFSSADRWRAVLSDPTSSVNDKAEAQKMLQEMGATGVRQASDDMQKLSADVAASNTVEFGGESYTVDELLKDETVAGIAKQYFEDPDAAARIKASSPGLAAFFDQHTQLFADATKNIGEAETSLDTALAGRKKDIDTLTTIFGGTANAQLLYPDLNKLTTDNIPMPAFISDPKLAQVDKVAYGSMLMGLQHINPDFAKQVMGLDYNTIKSLGLNTTEGIGQFQTFAAIQNQLNQDPANVDPDSVISSIYGDESALQANLGGLKVLGIKPDPLLDADGDGKLDGSQDILSRLRSKFAGQDLVSGFKGNNPSANQASLSKLVSQYQDPNTATGALFAAGADGRIDDNEVQAIGNKFAASQQLDQLNVLASKDPRFTNAYDAASLDAGRQQFAKTGAAYPLDDVQNLSQAVMNGSQTFDDSRNLINSLTDMQTNLNKMLQSLPPGTSPDTLAQYQQMATQVGQAKDKADRVNFLVNVAQNPGLQLDPGVLTWVQQNMRPNDPMRQHIEQLEAAKAKNPSPFGLKRKVVS